MGGGGGAGGRGGGSLNCSSCFRGVGLHTRRHVVVLLDATFGGGVAWGGGGGQGPLYRAHDRVCVWGGGVHVACRFYIITIQYPLLLT